MEIARNDAKGFTFVEILLALAIIGVLFVPLMQLFSHSLQATAGSEDRLTATYLARSEMEKVKNLGLTKAQYLALGDAFTPPMEEEPLKINGTRWRIQRDFAAPEGEDALEAASSGKPLEVRVHVYRDGRMEKPVMTLVTLIEDTIWEEIQPI